MKQSGRMTPTGLVGTTPELRHKRSCTKEGRGHKMLLLRGRY